MGSKTAARQAAMRAGVPVVPGTEEPLDERVPRRRGRGDRRRDRLSADAQGRRRRRRQGHAHGGVAPAELPGALRAARSEAGSAFGDSAVYLERRIMQPRHIEVQLLGDQHGTVLPFVERECTIQRRHQKVIEESPSPVVSPDLRRRITSGRGRGRAHGAATPTPARSSSCSTSDGEFYFLEMNTRLQVEHPITEMVTGVDLVAWQIRIARGERARRSIPRRCSTPRGHAHRMPHLRRGSRQRLPALARPDRGAARAAGPRRARRQRRVRRRRGADLLRPDDLEARSPGARRAPHALARMRRALAEYEVRGIKTTIPFFQWVLDDEDFVAGTVRHRASSTASSGARNGDPLRVPDAEHEELAAIAAALAQHAPAPDAAVRAGAALEPLAGRRRECRGGSTRTADLPDHLAMKYRTRGRRPCANGRDSAPAPTAITSPSTAARASSMPSASATTRWSLLACATPSGTARSQRRGRGDAAARATAASTCTSTGYHMPVQLQRRPRPPLARAGAAARGAGPQRVVAPMPGKVVRVLVKPGDDGQAAAGTGGRRSDEDGKRAARGPRRARPRGARRRRSIGRRRHGRSWSWSKHDRVRRALPARPR